MKPKDLKSPFHWKDRYPTIQESVFFVPNFFQNYHEYCFPGWKTIFPKERPIRLEFCSGNGEWIAQKSLYHTDSNWVAVEMRFDRVRRIWSKVQNYRLSNLFIICGEAFVASHYYIPKRSIEEIFINFPDPWPKNRHKKHRLMTPDFLKEVSRILVPSGKLTLVTDDRSYMESSLFLLHHCSDFVCCHPDPYYLNNVEDYGNSYFEQLWRKTGKEIYYLQFCKVT